MENTNTMLDQTTQRKAKLAKAVKYIMLAGTIAIIAMDVNAAAWKLSDQLKTSIVTPIVGAVKDYAALVVGIAAAGGLALGTQGDLRERAKTSGIGFLVAYGVVEVIKAMSNMAAY